MKEENSKNRRNDRIPALAAEVLLFQGRFIDSMHKGYYRLNNGKGNAFLCLAKHQVQVASNQVHL